MVEKAGVVGAVVVVDGALESLASKTVAMSGREGWISVWTRRRSGCRDVVGECKRVLPGVRGEIAGTAAAKADCQASLGTLALASVACRQGHRRSAGGECRSRGQNTKTF